MPLNAKAGDADPGFRKEEKKSLPFGISYNTPPPEPPVARPTDTLRQCYGASHPPKAAKYHSLLVNQRNHSLSPAMRFIHDLLNLFAILLTQLIPLSQHLEVGPIRPLVTECVIGFQAQMLSQY